MYSVKEIFFTLQGEGANAGRAAVFLRFAGCNLWTGKEKDREKAICKFCDTQFVGTDGENGGKFKTADRLAAKAAEIWCEESGTGMSGLTKRFQPLVVCTGGEPGLQLDKELVSELQDLNFEVAIETNGTVDLVDRGIDWICVSPKAGAQLKQISGDELKLVYPQPENEPKQFRHLDFKHFFLSPKNGSDGSFNERNMKLVVGYCLEHPQWRYNHQMHKLWGLK